MLVYQRVIVGGAVEVEVTISIYISMVIFNHFQSIFERSPEGNEYGHSHANESTNPRPGNLMVFNGILMSYLMGLMIVIQWDINGIL